MVQKLILPYMVPKEPMASYVGLVCQPWGLFERLLENFKLSPHTVAWRIGSAGAFLKMYHGIVFPATYT